MWETIVPGLAPGANRGRVTVAWRQSGGRLRATVSISKNTATEMGLTPPVAGKPKQRLLAQRDRATNRLRLAISSDAETWSPAWKDGCASFALPMPGVTVTERQPAKVCDYELVDGALIVKLPDWARGAAPAPRHAIPLVEPKPAPAPAPTLKAGRNTAAAMNTPTKRDADPNCPLARLPKDDVAEAREMLRGGKVGAKDLAEYFGWSNGDAVRIAAALRDEMALKGAA